MKSVLMGRPRSKTFGSRWESPFLNGRGGTFPFPSRQCRTIFRYTKARAKPPRTPRSIHSGQQSQACLAPSAKPAASHKPGPKTQAHLATQLSATSRRATPGRLPLPEVLLLLLLSLLLLLLLSSLLLLLLLLARCKP